MCFSLCRQLKWYSNTSMYVLFELRMQKLEGFKILVVDDMIEAWKYDVKVVNILENIMYL